MDKAWKVAGILFLVGGGLGFLAVACAFAPSDNEDIANHAIFYGIIFGSLAAIIGATIGFYGFVCSVVIGELFGVKNQNGSNNDSGYKKTKPSEYRVCLYCGLKMNPSWRESCQICGKPLGQGNSDPPRTDQRLPR